MDKRLAKQIIYGIFYLAVIFIFFGIIYFILIRPAPTCFDNRKNQNETGVDCGGSCLDCEIKTLSPIKIGWIKTFSIDDKAILAAEIKNSNSDYGADIFSYTIDIYSSDGGKIKSFSKKSFIYSGEIKYVAEILDINPKNISEAKISLLNVNWLRKKEFEKPKIQLREVLTKMNDKTIETSGIIINENAFTVSKIRIIGFLSNKSGIRISVSKTELENIEAFGEIPFKIIFPKGISLAEGAASSLFDLISADPNKTEIYAEAIR